MKNKIQIRVFTDIGQRDENQDAYFIDMDGKDGKSAIVALCDGVGAFSHAKETAEYVAKEIVKNIKHLHMSLNQAIDDVNSKVAKSDKYNYSTLAVVKIDDLKKIQFANCGDSRIYLVDNNVEQLSIDHTDESELISTFGFEKPAAAFFRRLTSCIGMDDLEVYSSVMQLEKESESLIILATDEAWELLEDGEWDRITHLKSAREKEKYIHTQLRYRKNESEDNITVISIIVNTLG